MPDVVSHEETAIPTLHAPESELERSLVSEFLRMAGHDADSLQRLPELDRNRLLAAASTYAADRLAEVDARARYVHVLHGQF